MLQESIVNKVLKVNNVFYLYTEIQEKGGNRVCSATSTHLAGCQFLPVHLHLTEGTKQDKREVVSVFQ